MNKRWLKIFVVMAAAAVLLTVAGFDLKVQANEKDEKEIRAAVGQFVSGFERGDIKLIDAVWAQDEAVTVFEGGHADKGWLNFRDKHLVPEMAAFKNVKYTFDETTVRVVASKTAWVTSRYNLTADFKERKIDSKGLITAVLEKRKGKWLIVHWHTSAARPQS